MILALLTPRIDSRTFHARMATEFKGAKPFISYEVALSVQRLKALGKERWNA